MRKKTLLILLLTLPFSAIYAQTKGPANLFQKKLSNGLDVLVVEDHSVPLVTLVMTFKAGPFTESEDSNGLTGMYMEMLQQGNRDYPSASAVGYNAGGLGTGLRNAGTVEEYSQSYFTLPAINFEKGMNFLNVAIRYPRFNAYELENVKKATINQLDVKESNPFYLLNEAVGKSLWGNYSYCKKAIGSREVVNEATVEKLKAVGNLYFQPDKAQLIIAGDISHVQAFDVAQKIYGDWPPSAVSNMKTLPITAIKPLSKSTYAVVENALVKTPTILIEWQGPDTRNDAASTYAADVFSFIINQNSSRLNKALVETGLASALSINYHTQKYVGPIVLTVIPNPTRVRECVDELKKQINRLDSDDYLTNAQLTNAKRMLEIKKIRDEEVTTTYVHSLAFWWASASMDYYFNYERNLSSVTVDNLRAYLRKYIKNKPFSAGLLINPELKAQLNTDDFFKTANLSH